MMRSVVNLNGDVRMINESLSKEDLDDSSTPSSSSSAFDQELLALEQELGLTQSDIQESICNVTTSSTLGIDEFLAASKGRLSSLQATVDAIWDGLDEEVLVDPSENDNGNRVMKDESGNDIDADYGLNSSAPRYIGECIPQHIFTCDQSRSGEERITQEGDSDLISSRINDEHLIGGITSLSSLQMMNPEQDQIQSSSIDDMETSQDDDNDESTTVDRKEESFDATNNLHPISHPIFSVADDDEEDLMIQQLKNEIELEAIEENEMYECRRQAQIARREVKADDERKRLIRMADAATLLQHNARPFLSRIMCRKRLSSIIRVQTNIRGKLARVQYECLLEQQRFTAATIAVQTYFRRFSARKELEQIRLDRQNYSAGMIQTAYRAKLARILLLRMREEKASASAIVIQSCCRGLMQRKRFIYMKQYRMYESATYIQKMIRGALERHRCKALKKRKEDDMRQAAALIQRFCHLKWTQFKDRYASILQRCWKCSREKRLNGAACRIQSLYRGHHMRTSLRYALSSNLSYMDSELDSIFSNEADSVLSEILLEKNQLDEELWQPVYPKFSHHLSESKLIKHGKSDHQISKGSLSNDKRSEMMKDWNLSDGRVVEAMMKRRAKMTKGKKREMKAKLMTDPHYRFEKKFQDRERLI